VLYLIADAIIVQPTSWRLVLNKNIDSQINDKKVYKGILSKSLIFFWSLELHLQTSSLVVFWFVFNLIVITFNLLNYFNWENKQVEYYIQG